MSGSDSYRSGGSILRDTTFRFVRAALPPAVTGLALFLLLPISVQSHLGAALALAAALLFIVLIVAGIEGTAIAMLFLGVGFSPLNRLHPVQALSFVTVSDAFLLVGCLLLVPVVLSRPFRPQAMFAIGVGGVVFVGLVASIVNPAPVTSLSLMVRLLVGALVLPIVFVAWRPRREVIVAFAVAYVMGNVVNTADSLLSGITSVGGRYIGFTEHPNIFGFCAMLGLALIPFLLQELPRRFWWLVFGAAAACAGGVWLSGSRAALIVTVVVAVIYPFLARSIEAALVLFGLSIVPVFLVVRQVSSGDVGQNAIGRLLGGGSAEASDAQRELLIEAALAKFREHPIFGTGFGDVIVAHNIYLQIAAAGGVMLLLFYLLLLGSVIRQPLIIGSSYRLLALPALAYVLIGPLTPLLWDRYIWCAVALPFLVPLAERREPRRAHSVPREPAALVPS